MTHGRRETAERIVPACAGTTEGKSDSFRAPCWCRTHAGRSYPATRTRLRGNPGSPSRSGRADRPEVLAVDVVDHSVDDVVEVRDIHHALAGVAEIKVEAAVRVVGDQREIIAGRAGADARRTGSDQAAPRHQRQRVGDVVARSHRCRHQAARTEGRIEHAGGRVARHHEIAATVAHDRRAGDDDASVRLAHHRVGHVLAGADARARDAAGAEGRIRRAVGVEAHQQELGVAGTERIARDEDLAVRLDQQRARFGVSVCRLRRVDVDLAAGAEQRIQLAARGMARQCDMIGAHFGGESGGNDHSIRLHGDGVALIEQRAAGARLQERGHRVAGAVERPIQRTVAHEARGDEIGRGARAEECAAADQAAVCHAAHGAQAVAEVLAEIDVGDAVGAEPAIEHTGSRDAGQHRIVAAGRAGHDDVARCIEHRSLGGVGDAADRYRDEHAVLAGRERPGARRDRGREERRGDPAAGDRHTSGRHGRRRSRGGSR